MTKKTLCKEQNFRGDYNKIFSKTMNFIAINCFSDIGKCEKILINDYEVNIGNYFDELEKDIKKYLIQNKLFISGVKVEEDVIIITVTTDIYDLLFVPEIKEDEPTDEQKEEIRREQAIEDYENCKKEHEKSCPKCRSIATNLAPNGAGVEEETYWHCEKCGWEE
ncbi:TPA: hypothetical protein N2D78_003474 [Clostridium botulinum]|uniref:hypothetical protein n=1 Tax=Clostridium botulinum TaxID=1491 RepID=UPI0007738971|nr:hypothetical protein [Clostridium botulinum]HCL4466674.1 hypothetical protein [Clostridium botulinum]HCL4470316.1 hypothetical protein [Clostridium botulinum]HCL4485520.1 hypothetical protein [Clostridium botulinum]HCL4496278.1 hypothetical protein [Clostridium botulinum]HCL4499878.1 hypothetical protein [Clostridium botulinum]